MSDPITAAATMTCMHQGAIAMTSSEPTLTIDGSPVFTTAGVATATITGCQNKLPNSTPNPCLVAADQGASLLTVNGNPVLLADALTTGPTGAATSFKATVQGEPTYVTTD